MFLIFLDYNQLQNRIFNTLLIYLTPEIRTTTPKYRVFFSFAIFQRYFNYSSFIKI